VATGRGGGRIAQRPSRLVEASQRDHPRVTAWPSSFVARSLAAPEAERTASSPSAISASSRACRCRGVWVVSQHLDIVAGLTPVTTERFRRSRRRGGS